jgi:hypothetical protein
MIVALSIKHSSFKLRAEWLQRELHVYVTKRMYGNKFVGELSQ